MRKIPTLFQRDPDNRRLLLADVTPGCEWVLAGEGRATRKWDGTCLLYNGDDHPPGWFARRAVKPGKDAPVGFIEVDHDPVTGKRVGWEPAHLSGFARWFAEAIEDMDGITFEPGTYELIGPKVNGNPEQWDMHWLVRHGIDPHPLGHMRTYAELAMHLPLTHPEGIVWHHPDGRMAKIKRRDFPW